MSLRRSKTDPVILEMPPQKMAVVQGKGAPDVVIAELMPPLFGSVYTLKFDLKKKGVETFKVGAPRARYPDAQFGKKDDWTIIIGVPVPEDTTYLPQKDPSATVKLETWKYGTIGQILHIGPYDQEMPNIEKLQKFIAENGYEIAGPHEEEYLTTPEAKVIKTIIRYEIKKKAS